MPKERNAFKLGLTLIVFAVLLIGILVYLAPTGRGDMTIMVRFPHNQLTIVLTPGSEVVCGGNTVGSVQSHDLKEMKDEAFYSRSLIFFYQVQCSIVCQCF